MELSELKERLIPFCKAMYEDEAVEVTEVSKMPGHAGFSFGFTVQAKASTENWFLRLPPPNVKLQGTADVLRQVAALNALENEPVPHCVVKWSGDDLQWFGRPYFIVPQLEGDVLRMDNGDWVERIEKTVRYNMARQATAALANIHKVDWHKARYLGNPIEFEDDVLRWDRFVGKAADPKRLVMVPKVKELLLKQIPQKAPIGIFHGDFQWSNLFYSFSGELLAVIDWELVGVGAILNDIGWFATFNDPEAWAENRNPGSLMPHADELVEMYLEAYDQKLPDLNWYRALAAYKFAIITGFNLMLHRRGKRDDPLWEVTKESIEPLLERAYQLLKS